MYVLDPISHGTYFDEIRLLVSPDHSLTESDMSNSLIRSFSFLGAAETKVLRATNQTTAALKPTGDDASAVPDNADGLQKRQWVRAIQLLTAISLLEPQILQQSELGDTVRMEEVDIESRKKELQNEVVEIIPDIFTPTSPTGAVDSVIGVSSIKGTF